MKKILKKLKSQRGATGPDVLMAVSMIVIAVGVVSMLYVNTTLQTRNITRTAGATRIATNIIENINSMSYKDFINEIPTGTLELEGVANSFNTNIPKGFSVTITASKAYGSHTNESEQYDLVRSINVKVKYRVGKVEEKIEFSTVKQRELMNECNAPATGDLRESMLGEGVNYYPVKYMASARGYVRTTEDDPEWYNYDNKEWPTVIISKLPINDLFDANGKLKATINVTKENDNYTQKAIWIPRYFIKKDAEEKDIMFAYKANDERTIVKQQLIAEDGVSTYQYYDVEDLDTTIWDKSYSTDVFGAKTGKWALVGSSNSLNVGDYFVFSIQNSQYGPCNMH